MPDYSISNYLEGEDIDLDIYMDTTRFFESGDSLVLKNSNLIPNNPNMDSLYYYESYIDASIPSYYFIWNRNLDPYEFDPDTDHT